MYQFIGRDSWRETFILKPDSFYDKFKNKEVEILRPLWFFHAEQKGIKVEDLMKYYTDLAIMQFEQYEFIKINYEDGKKDNTPS